MRNVFPERDQFHSRFCFPFLWYFHSCVTEPFGYITPNFINHLLLSRTLPKSQRSAAYGNSCLAGVRACVMTHVCVCVCVFQSLFPRNAIPSSNLLYFRAFIVNDRHTQVSYRAWSWVILFKNMFSDHKTAIPSQIIFLMVFKSITSHKKGWCSLQHYPGGSYLSSQIYLYKPKFVQEDFTICTAQNTRSTSTKLRSFGGWINKQKTFYSTRKNKWEKHQKRQKRSDPSSRTEKHAIGVTCAKYRAHRPTNTI